jgi:hypothetical protein
MNIEELKKLRLNSPAGPWRVGRNSMDNPAGVWSDHLGIGWVPMACAAEYVVALENLAPELIALWEAVDEDNRWEDGSPCDCPRPVCKALNDLNSKAAAMVG